MPFSDYGPKDLGIHLMNCFLQMFTASCYLVINSDILSIFFAFNCYIDAFCNDFRKIFDRIDEQLNLGARCDPTEVHKMLLEAYTFENDIIE